MKPFFEKAGPKEQIQLFISAKNLKKMDMMSDSDPLCQVYHRESIKKPYTFLGKTEKLTNVKDPVFSTSFTIDYFFEKSQWLKFEFFDIDDGDEEDDFIGSLEVKVSQLMMSENLKFKGILKRKDHPNDDRGILIVQLESMRNSNMTIHFQLAADLKTQETCCAIDDPYFQISRMRPLIKDVVVCH